jgi:DNA-directed RNA polymerase subunit H (RpoH/RPB5)
MHIENELVEFVTIGEQEYDEVIEEYVEEAQELPWTDTADTAPVQGML